MTKAFLIATVAAIAISAPAHAQRGDRGEAEQRAQKADRAEQRAKRSAARPQAAERRQKRVRVERPQARERVRAERPQVRERVRAERPQPRQRIERQRAAPQRIERQRIQRAERQRAAPQRIERQRIERPVRSERTVRVQQRPAERRVRIDNRDSTRVAPRQQLQQRRLEQQQIQQRRAERTDRRQITVDRLAERAASATQLRELRQQRQARLQRPSRTRGERIDLSRQDRREAGTGYATARYSSRYDSSPQHFYYRDYDDGYLYQVRRDTNVVTASYPLLGGAFAVSQPLPAGYTSYNVPYAYRPLYYDTPNYSYRYGDGAIYRVDSSTLLIQAVVALLTGNSLGIGQMLPMGYDVYNVPYGYRSTYFDTDELWYRYSDGYIYGIDPYTRRIVSMYPVSYGGYAVGYPVPSYATYGGYTGFGAYGGYPGYSTPYGYDHLYYGQPGYNYHYANGGIYQVDPATRLVTALVALLTGANLGVGQMLPMGYDVYNVPYAYRGTYFDTADSWYRYNDGYIYEVDPYSRMIQAAIPVSYGGYMVGQPVPAAYPGYAVPAHYSGLYVAQPGYDYRYFDGGIYQIDPNSRIVDSQVALLTGQTWGVGQMLPMGYDAYNVPYAWRDRYYDSDRYMYRYADGYIYQVDPTTRLIQAVIDAVA
jgi:hypothetical protein